MQPSTSWSRRFSSVLSSEPPSRKPGSSGGPDAAQGLPRDDRGRAASFGSRFLSGYRADRSTELVERFERAGLTILGTTNTPELALLSSCEPLAFGPTANPWDASRSPGGSSGAAAAAVASRAVPVAHGNDSGGSLRIPASDCGVFGLKPSRARNSLAPFGDLASGLWCEHVISWSVRDSAAVLDAVHGPAAGEPYFARAPLRGFAEAAERPGDRLRIALTLDRLGGGALHPDCVRAAELAAQACEELGHHVVPLRRSSTTSRWPSPSWR